jgi:hypothetical protein
MSALVVQGTVKPDGTLELNQKLALPAGPVQITIQPILVSKPPNQDWWQYLQAARAVLETRGTGFRSQEEIEAERKDFRSENEHLENLGQTSDEERRRLEPKEC